MQATRIPVDDSEYFDNLKDNLGNRIKELLGLSLIKEVLVLDSANLKRKLNEKIPSLECVQLCFIFITSISPTFVPVFISPTQFLPVTGFIKAQQI